MTRDAKLSNLLRRHAPSVPLPPSGHEEAMIAAFRASRARRRLVSATVVATLAAAALALTLLPSSFTNAQDPLVIEILGEVTDNYTTDQEEELEPVYRDWQLLAVALADH